LAISILKTLGLARWLNNDVSARHRLSIGGKTQLTLTTRDVTLVGRRDRRRGLGSLAIG